MLSLSVDSNGRVYAGTGRRGALVAGGLLFTPLAEAPLKACLCQNVYGVSVDPSDRLHLIIATNDGGMIETRNGGSTWQDAGTARHDGARAAAGGVRPAGSAARLRGGVHRQRLLPLDRWRAQLVTTRLRAADAAHDRHGDRPGGSRGLCRDAAGRRRLEEHGPRRDVHARRRAGGGGSVPEPQRARHRHRSGAARRGVPRGRHRDLALDERRRDLDAHLDDQRADGDGGPDRLARGLRRHAVGGRAEEHGRRHDVQPGERRA